MKLTKSKLRKMIKEEIQRLDERSDVKKLEKLEKQILKNKELAQQWTAELGGLDYPLFYDEWDKKSVKAITKFAKELLSGKFNESVNVMKLTKSQLREIIREEIQKLNERKEPNIDGVWIKSVLSKNGIKFKSVKRTWFSNDEAEYDVKLVNRSDEYTMYDALESAGWKGGKSKTGIFSI